METLRNYIVVIFIFFVAGLSLGSNIFSKSNPTAIEMKSDIIELHKTIDSLNVVIDEKDSAIIEQAEVSQRAVQGFTSCMAQKRNMIRIIRKFEEGIIK